MASILFIKQSNCMYPSLIVSSEIVLMMDFLTLVSPFYAISKRITSCSIWRPLLFTRNLMISLPCWITCSWLSKLNTSSKILFLISHYLKSFSLMALVLFEMTKEARWARSFVPVSLLLMSLHLTRGRVASAKNNSHHSAFYLGIISLSNSFS